MNFLAHAYLSGDSDLLLIGNFIADSLRGNSFHQYPKELQKGIHLHRKIDIYTDSHPAVISTKEKIRKDFGKYASVVTDIYYDHFLAYHWTLYSDTPLSEYVGYVYKLLEEYKQFLPDDIQGFLPYMIRDNWLFNYGNFHGLEKVFKGMAKRASHTSNMEQATQVLKNHYDSIEADFFSFFPEVKKFALNEIYRLS
ncbi:MAG: ACP phosphodiesterase [Cytophagaceae bacterium]|nr:ACP phosphodiesterase [Cytophagaceae bacterium]MDW8455962.1 ACP phosphodiesterase [Cytophagaceae bacterium]